MKLFCPRCNKNINDVDEQFVAQGICPDCEGQLTYGGVIPNLPISGAVAMTFSAGSKVSAPLDASFEETKLTIDNNEMTWPASESTPDSRENPAETSHENEDAFSPGQDTAPSDASTSSAINSEVTKTVQKDEAERSNSPTSPGEEPLAEDIPVNDDLPGEYESSHEDSSDTPAPEQDTPIGAGAHLQLPAIDFSLPSFSPDAEASSTSKLGQSQTNDTATSSDQTASATPTDELPAHLQLPSFPAFELPPIPGSESEQQAADFHIKDEAGETGSFGITAETSIDSETPEPLMAPIANMSDTPPSKESESWSVAPVTDAGIGNAPPPLPPIDSAASQASQPGAHLPNLPPLQLPNFTKQTSRSEPTLLQSDAAQEIMADMEGKKGKGVFVLLFLVLLVFGGAGGAIYYFGTDKVISHVTKAEKVVPKLTSKDKAENFFFEGVKQYKKKNINEAINQFEKALNLHPKMSQAHRSIAIAYAKSNRQQKAVEHYRTYLKLSPNAEDAPKVQKLITDYEKAKTKKKRKKRR